MNKASILLSMIHHALELIELELNTYFKSLPNHPDDAYVILGNVAALESESGGDTEEMKEKVIITLVNIEEESAYKNLPNYSRTTNGAVRYLNAPVFLNLYLLFASNLSPKRYPTALQYLTELIQFFQSKNVFSLKSAPGFKSSEPLEPDLAEVQLILDLYTMTFEQINHLWGSLGGKQMPFVMYKARLVKMLDRRTTGTGTLVEEVARKESVVEK